MKSSRHLFYIASIVTTVGFVFAVAITSNTTNNPFNIHAEKRVDGYYHLVMNDFSSLSLNDYHVNTDDGNLINFKVTGESSSNHLILGSDEEFLNESMLSGVHSVTVIFSGGGTLSLQSSNTSNYFVGSSETLSSGVTYTLEDDMDFIRLYNSDASNDITITQIDIAYSCSLAGAYTYTLSDDHYILGIRDKSLTSYYVPSTYNRLDVTMSQGLFEGCTNIESVNIPNLNGQLFAYYFSTSALPGGYINRADLIPSSLTSVTIREGSIPENAFNSCNHIESLTLVNVTSIGNDAFSNSSRSSLNALSSVNLGSSLTSIGRTSFAYSNLTSITIPSTVVNAYSQIFYSSNDSLVITVNLASKPNKWNAMWNYKDGSNAFTTYWLG